MNDIGSKVMLGYMQDWGQSVDKRIAVLNDAVKAAGIGAVFTQDSDGRNPRWIGSPESRERATEFRNRLDNCWCGEFNEECRNVEALIEEFKKAAVPAQGTTEGESPNNNLTGGS